MNDQQKKNLRNFLYRKISNAEDTVPHIMGLFFKTNGAVILDDSLPAPAQINMSTLEMGMNPSLIADELVGFMERLEAEGKTLAEVIPGGEHVFFSHNEEESLAVMWRLFLTLHEVGHGLYSPTTEAIKNAFNAFCLPVEFNGKTLPVPVELAFFCLNVVEDCFIQTQFCKEYPGRRYRAAIALGQKYGQGDIDGYGRALINNDSLSIHNKLYYFIIRGYNEYHPDVLRMWGHPEKLGWSDATIEAFDKAQCIVDKNRRMRTVFEDFVPKVFLDLIEEIKNSSNGDPAGAGNLLAEDKIRIGDDSSKSASGAPHQQQSEKSEQSKQSEKDNGTGDKEGASQKEDGDAEKNKTEEGNDTQSSSSSATSTAQKDNPSKEYASEEEILEEFKKELLDACQKLNEHIHETVERQDSTEALRKPTDALIRRRRLDSIGCARANWSSMNYGLNTLPPSTMRLYEECSSWFSKLYNNSDYTIHRLEQGDLDPTTMMEWYTEKNHVIYSVDVKATQGRTFQVIFILDSSGSMGHRFTISSRVLAAMAHAMDDVRIPSAIYLFDTKSTQIKEVDDPINLTANGDSDVYGALMRNQSHGYTNPSGAFDALKYDTAYQNEDTKIVFFLTDGQMDSHAVEALVQDDIKELTARGNWFFVNIGIDFTQGDLVNLSSFTKPGICRAYSSNEIVNKLGEDIYNIIADNFIKI